MGVLAGTAAAVPGVRPVAESTVRLRDLARLEKGSSMRLFCACFDPSTGLQSLHYTTWFSLSPRRPWDVHQERVDLELHSVSCASLRMFPRRWELLSRRGGFGKMIIMRNFNYSTRTSKFFILEEPLYRYRPALGASASRHFAFACWTGGWRAFARSPLTRPLQPLGILLLDSLEDGFSPWPPKTTDEPHSSSLFSVQGERESPPFSGKPPETLNDLFRSPARRGPFTQKTSIQVFGHVLLSEGFRNAPRVKAND